MLSCESQKILSKRIKNNKNLFSSLKNCKIFSELTEFPNMKKFKRKFEDQLKSLKEIPRSQLSTIYQDIGDLKMAKLIWSYGEFQLANWIINLLINIRKRINNQNDLNDNNIEPFHCCSICYFFTEHILLNVICSSICNGIDNFTQECQNKLNDKFKWSSSLLQKVKSQINPENYHKYAQKISSVLNTEIVEENPQSNSQTIIIQQNLLESLQEWTKLELVQLGLLATSAKDIVGLALKLDLYK